MSNAATRTAEAARPAPHLISFAPECFEAQGETVHFTVSRSALHSGPARFDSRAEADAYAAKTDRPVTEHRAPRLVRVRWTLA